jgi:hypothetical protein
VRQQPLGGIKSEVADLNHIGWLCSTGGEGVKHRVKLARPIRCVERVAPPHVREGVLKRPKVTSLKVLMLRRVPLLEDVSNLSFATRSSLKAAQDKIVSHTVIDAARLIRVNAIVCRSPRLHKLTNRTRNDLRQVTHDVSGVAATKHNLVRENQVGANERRITSRDASAESLVVRVAEAHDSADLVAVFATYTLDLKQAKVALTITVQSVVFVDDLKIGVADRLAELAHQRIVSNWMPAVRRFGRRDGLDFGEVALLRFAHVKAKEFLICRVCSFDVHSINFILGYYLIVRLHHKKKFTVCQANRKKKKEKEKKFFPLCT